MAKKKKKVDDEVYQVEVIKAARVNDEGDWEYQIKWAGYDDEHNTWEPRQGIEENCQRLLSSFWNHIGLDNEDYYPGDELPAGDEWIEEEIERFHNQNKKSKPMSTKRSKTRPDSEETTASSSKASKGSKSKRKAEVKAESSDDEAQLHPTKKRRIATPTDNDSDDDDIPLRIRTLSQSTLKGKEKETAPEPSGPRTEPAEGDAASLFSDDDNAVSPESCPAKPQPLTSKPSTSRSALKRPKPPPLTIPRRKETESGQKSAGAPSSAKSASRSTTNTPNISSVTTGFIKPSRRIHPVPDESMVASGSSLTTKNRIAEYAMRPINPKAQEEKKSSDATRQLLSAKKQTLNQLSFKKKAPSITANPTITDLDMAPRIPTYSPTVPPYSPAFTTTSTDSPSIPALDPTTTMTSLNGAPSPASTQGDTNRVLSEPIVISPIGQDLDMDPTSLYGDQSPMEDDFDPVNRAPTAAEAFLQSLMPAEMAAPLEAKTVPQEQVDEIVAPSRTSLATVTSSLTAFPGRIQKKWKWTGPIVMQPDHEPQTLCEATLFDTEQLQKNGMPFRIALQEDEPLVFQKYLPLEVLEGILLASNPTEAIAFMKAKDEDNAAALGKWAGYLVYHKQIAMARVELDGMYAANIIVAPSNIRALLQRLSVPLDLNNDAPLFAVLATWALPREKRAEDWRLPFKDRLHLAEQMRALDTEQDPAFRSAMWDEGGEERKPNLRMAVRILRYPKWMHDHMGLGNERQYCIWPPHAQRDATMEMEVLDLTTIMKEYQNAEYKDLTETNVRVVFIHSRARKTIENIQNLIEWRAKRIDTMFVVFGSCSAPLHGNDWHRGFWEIYPIGGVLTFTADALLNDACQILHKVQQIGDHQLWTGYIIPTVLGMAVRLAYQKRNGDPLKDYEEGCFPFLFLLDAIDNGLFGLLRAPPQPKDEQEPTNQWIGAQIDHVVRDQRDTLEFCLAEFSSKYANVPVEKWKVTLEEEISSDLRQMQIQPGLMEEYRRFVILCDEDMEDTNLHGLEWVTPRFFEFHDDFDDGTPPPDSPTL